MTEFEREVETRLAGAAQNADLRTAASGFMERSIEARYSYNWFWMGRPIIQYPQDICALQELVWKVRPDVIVETGIAHGGSLVLSASLLAMLDLCDATEAGTTLDPARPKRRVVGVDIDIREHNRAAIEAHPMSKRITMIQGSSVDPDIVARVRQEIGDAGTVLVCLDSNHTHDHVLRELEAYAPMVTVGSYCVVFDTVIENLPSAMYSDRPWDVGDNAMTGMREFLSRNPGFEIDHAMDAKLQISVAPNGYLRRTR
ncbi:cephalosporin hydroxylase family protein [Rhodobacteraceae bacterium HSP-20]|uniref:Cephalosporin hydroxylase family protein n=1 Tax=Paragemmobacter amnigenus TaxID=2852097 RepID=A0ABS6J6Z1_9RHOB|nr:cephalosporin hydroxylase family protein [Rhodobacter amnigenus]MBU9698232.1 cephalosporin hydroxylase family protein [Rhodobacter amnigenus]MBV4389459.1 cephalosporin hydroxylase family protein [Rhodobacter amnigenus]